jgi:hypothetical protein
MIGAFMERIFIMGIVYGALGILGLEGIGIIIWYLLKKGGKK